MIKDYPEKETESVSRIVQRADLFDLKVARIDNLKKQKDVAAARLKSERDRQKITRAQHAIADLSKPS